jgi:nitrite reductase/ring-hydroxylating ferredoxin subunit
MLEIGYTKVIPFPFEIVLSQYFDYEHIAHVHPETLGEYRLVEVSTNRIVYDQIWPALWTGKRKTSRVEQRFSPPNAIEFEFIAGLHRGVKVQTFLHDQGDATRVEESYFLPLPNWDWLKPVIRPFMMQSIERIWKEDIDVGVCYGGWPGIEGRPASHTSLTAPASPLQRRHLLGKAADFPPGSRRLVVLEGNEIALFHQQDGFWAMENRCSHTGGPLMLGAMEGEAVVCPWHGAQFDRKTGSVLCGPARRALQTYTILVEEGNLILLSPPAECVTS